MMLQRDFPFFAAALLMACDPGAGQPTTTARASAVVVDEVTPLPTKPTGAPLEPDLPPTDGWNGTGHQDPPELRDLPDEEMLMRARKVGDAGQERLMALVSVGRRKCDGALDALALALSDSSIVVRRMAISGLFEHGGPDALGLLWTAAENDHPKVRGDALTKIAPYGPEEAERAVRVGLADSDPFVQGMGMSCIRGLRPHHDKALRYARAGLASDVPYVWQNASTVLHSMPHAGAGALLEAQARASKGEKRNLLIQEYRLWLRNHPDLAPRVIEAAK